MFGCNCPPKLSLMLPVHPAGCFCLCCSVGAVHRHHCVQAPALWSRSAAGGGEGRTAAHTLGCPGGVLPVDDSVGCQATAGNAGRGFGGGGFAAVCWRARAFQVQGITFNAFYFVFTISFFCKWLLRGFEACICKGLRWQPNPVASVPETLRRRGWGHCGRHSTEWWFVSFWLGHVWRSSLLATGSNGAHHHVKELRHRVALAGSRTSV